MTTPRKRRNKSQRPGRDDELVRMFNESPAELANQLVAMTELLDTQLADSYEDDAPHIKMLAYFVRDLAAILYLEFRRRSETGVRL